MERFEHLMKLIKYFIFKRIADFLISTFLFVLLLMPLLFIFFLIIILNQINPIFVQKRSGYKKRIIKIFKLKTFKNNKITKFGSILRKFKIDEIPQLINVIKGDLSLIGPRPLLRSYDDHYTLFQNKRFDVMPGITGLSQIKIKNTNNWKHKFTYDVFYARNISLKLDLLIAYLTFKLLIEITIGKKNIIEDHTPFVK